MITVGGINFTEAIVNLEYELQRTQRILQWVIANNHGLVQIPKDTLNAIDAQSLQHVQQKYPEAGVAPKSQFGVPNVGLQRRGVPPMGM